MKRKLIIEEFGDKKEIKMLKTINSENAIKEETLTLQMNTEDDTIVPIDVNRSFEYKLTDKKAKGNLIKGATREPFKKEVRQKSMNLVFCTGTYKTIVMPTIEDFYKNSATAEYYNFKIDCNDLIHYTD